MSEPLELRRSRRTRETGRGPVRRRGFSVRSRIIAAILAATAVGLAGSGGASYLVQRERVLASVDADQLRLVDELRSMAENGTGDEVPATVVTLLRASMQQLLPAAHESVLGLVDGAPAFVPATTLPFRIDDDPAFVERILSEADATKVVRGTAHSTLGNLRYIIVPISVAGDTDEGLYVSAYDLDAVLLAVADSFRTYIVVALIALLLVGFVAWFVSGRLLRPIRLLRRAAIANTATDLSARIPVTGRDDLSELTETINGMFERLESAFSSQRRLIDDVGHELKTPLTIIRGHLELLDPENPADVAATKALTIDELDRMSTLVGEISLLAETGTPQFVDRREVDIAEFTDGVFAKARGLDPGREWILESRAEGVGELDARRLTQAWLQLASNAVKHSTAGGSIVLGSERIETRSGESLQLLVCDVGPGIPREAQDRIFERFGRLDVSRGADGSGLGLAIVAAIAEAHGGTVALSSDAGQGSVFTIRVPLGTAARTTGETR